MRFWILSMAAWVCPKACGSRPNMISAMVTKCCPAEGRALHGGRSAIGQNMRPAQLAILIRSV